MSSIKAKIALLGATGYVGTRLLHSLLSENYHIKAFSRNSNKLGDRFDAFTQQIEKIDTDLTDVDTLATQVKGSDVLVYLVHSMRAASSRYDLVDDKLAVNTALAA